MHEQSTKSKPKSKPAKPHPDYPLFAHSAGVWAKKIRGRLHYFGPWSDPQAALEKWLREKDYLLAGKIPPAEHDPDALTVGKMVNLCIESRDRKVQTGERSYHTVDKYKAVGREVIEHFGRTTIVETLTPADFAAFRVKLATGRNLKTLEGRITYARAFFHYANKNGYIERSLTKLWGTEFDKPCKTAVSKLSAETVRLFEGDEIRKLLQSADHQLKAMILLGINAAFGPTDIGIVKQSDIREGWLMLARRKTGKSRRVPLWAETIKAIEAAKRHRPKPKDEADNELLFITKYGRSWLPDSTHFPLTAEFTKLRKRCGITGKGKSFYALRHTFQTIGDEVRDFIATSAIMGHIDQTISGIYREKIGDDRLQAVTDHVRQWLFGKPKAAKKPTKRSGKGGAK